MVWRPNMLPCNSSAWQHWKQHSAQRKRSDAGRSCSRARYCTSGSFTRSCLVFIYYIYFPSQQQDPNRSNKNDDPEWLWYALTGTVETTNQPPTSQYPYAMHSGRSIEPLWTSARRQRAWLLQLVDHKPESISKHVFRR